MKTIQIQSIALEPSSNEVISYVDFLIGRLMQLGIGGIEASRDRQNIGKIDFIFTSHKTGKTETVASIEPGFFRPLLARFGPRCGANDLLYGGQTFFACEGECEGKMRLHRFSLFVCNEPAMDIWLKLYFYCIDGIWPMRKEVA